MLVQICKKKYFISWVSACHVGFPFVDQNVDNFKLKSILQLKKNLSLSAMNFQKSKRNVNKTPPQRVQSEPYHE